MSTFVWIAAFLCLPAVALAQASQPSTRPATWTADNGDGTFTNPLFYDEFSDPDLIRVGDDYYLTGTTMHAMPGLPILHSRDLVNWRFLTYACDKLDLGPAFRLEEGKDVYGQGIWAPTFRYRDGTFYIFTNVNGQKTQLFTAKNPAGPWTRTPMRKSFHDLSVLFDDDGKAYVIWGYKGLKIAQLTEDLLDTVPGTERDLIDEDAGMGEGVHFYKIDGKYVITSAWFEGRMRMPCARADKLEGPWEVNPAISIDEDWGLAEGNRLSREGQVVPGNTRDGGRMSLHQGGLVQTQTGEWWAWSMMDANSVGRLTGLSPVTWSDGWPYFGLPGNLKRTPRTWTKPNTGFSDPPHAPYERSDDFSGDKLKPVWQWNHVPIDNAWSLTERPGFLRLHTQPAKDFWTARNTLTQRAIGPRSTPTVVLDVSGMKPGDVAGLGLLNHPYAWIGVRRGTNGSLTLECFDEQGKFGVIGGGWPLPAGTTRAWLRAECDFLTERATCSFSADGQTFKPLGGPWPMVFQLRTFQGIRYSLFAFNDAGANGGHADFDSIDVHEPNPRGLMRPIPAGQRVQFAGVNEGANVIIDGMRTFVVTDLGRQRVGLRAIDGGFVTVAADGALALTRVEKPGDAESFVWSETLNGDVTLTSLATHRLLRAAGDASKADAAGPKPDRKDGVSLAWRPATD